MAKKVQTKSCMWQLRMEAYLLSEKGLGDVVEANFDPTLPTTQVAALDESQPLEKAQIDARTKNSRAMNCFVQALGTPQPTTHEHGVLREDA